MYEIYTVVGGDTIQKIAAKYNVDPAIIYQINGFDPDYVPTLGTNIIVPVRANANFEYYTIKKGDNLYKIAQKYNTNPRLLAILNGLDESDYIYPEQVIMVPKQGISFYIVRQGDTLNTVAKMLNTNIMNLLNQNSNIYLQPDQIIAFRENNI